MRFLNAASFLLAASAAVAAPALADDTKPATVPPATTPPASAETQPPATTTADPIDPAGSSDDLNDEIARMRPRPAGLLPNGPISLIDPLWDDMNAKLDKSIGLKVGAAYTAVLQRSSESSDDERNASGGDTDLFAKMRFFGDDKSPTRGVLGVYGECRRGFGDPVPKDLSAKFDSLWRTTNGFGEQKSALTQCWWEQHMAKDNLVVTFGKVDPDNFYNKNRYQSDNTAFLSQAFSANPARKHPGNGLGANVLYRLAKEWYATTGVNDANGSKMTSGFHSIDQGQLFYAVEAGWTPTFEDQGKGAYRLTAWHIDDATIEGIPQDHGIALSCEQELCTHYVPFFRAAWSQGDATGVGQFVCGGIGLEGVVLGKADLTGIGVAWGDPTDQSYRNQLGGEVFHRFQLSPDVQLTVGYQYIVDPAKAPSSSHGPVGVFEVRIRIEF